jgi:hypothetical protein
MKIELWKITDVKPYPNNPRINDDAVDAVAASLREFGFRQPIVVDAEGVIICGHTRYKAALKLGLEKVPVHVAKDLTPEQIKAYRIADNKTAELSDWNYELLPIELEELKACDYDLGLLGFDQDELAKLLDPGVKDGLCDPDEVPAAPPTPDALLPPRRHRRNLPLVPSRRLRCQEKRRFPRSLHHASRMDGPDAYLITALSDISSLHAARAARRWMRSRIFGFQRAAVA